MLNKPLFIRILFAGVMLLAILLPCLVFLISDYSIQDKVSVSNNSKMAEIGQNADKMASVSGILKAWAQAHPQSFESRDGEMFIYDQENNTSSPVVVSKLSSEEAEDFIDQYPRVIEKVKNVTSGLEPSGFSKSAEKFISENSLFGVDMIYFYFPGTDSLSTTLWQLSFIEKNNYISMLINPYDSGIIAVYWQCMDDSVYVYPDVTEVKFDSDKLTNVYGADSYHDLMGMLDKENVEGQFNSDQYIYSLGELLFGESKIYFVNQVIYYTGQGFDWFYGANCAFDNMTKSYYNRE